jgi:hypothetical protein
VLHQRVDERPVPSELVEREFVAEVRGESSCRPGVGRRLWTSVACSDADLRLLAIDTSALLSD